MYHFNRRSFLTRTASAAAAASLFPHTALAAPTQIETFTSSPGGFFVDSVVIVGAEKANVLDAQFTHADASALAEQIAATGTTFGTIFVSHYHPDHIMGIATLEARYPEARVVAHPDVAAQVAQTGPGAWAEYQDFLGFPSDYAWTAPEPLDGPLTLDGEAFEIIGPVVGDTGLITPVALPHFNAIFASDVVYNGVGVYFAETTTPEASIGWRAALDLLEARPETVIIPGHRSERTTDDQSGIDFTRNKLGLWEQALAQGTDRERLAAAIRDVMGDDPDGFCAVLALDAIYPQ